MNANPSDSQVYYIAIPCHSSWFQEGRYTLQEGIEREREVKERETRKKRKGKNGREGECTLVVGEMAPWLLEIDAPVLNL